MSLHNGPIRPGARGGRGEFSWDKVKGDQDASYYIGHSVKALSGRWQKGKDVYWYTRGKSDQGLSVDDERKAVKQKEEQLMLEALGLKPKSLPAEHQPMDQKELDAIIKKNAPEKEEGTQQESIKGLGFAPGACVGGGVAVRTTLEGINVPTNAEVSARQRGAGPSGAAEQQQHLPPPPPLPFGSLTAVVASGGVLSKEQIKQLSKVDKKAAKAAKKARKKAKKEAKRSKREAKKEAKGQKRGREPEEAGPSSKRVGHTQRHSPLRDSSSSGSGSESSRSGDERLINGHRSSSPPAQAKASRHMDSINGRHERSNRDGSGSRGMSMRKEEDREMGFRRGSGSEQEGRVDERSGSRYEQQRNSSQGGDRHEERDRRDRYGQLEKGVSSIGDRHTRGKEERGGSRYAEGRERAGSARDTGSEHEQGGRNKRHRHDSPV